VLLQRVSQSGQRDLQVRWRYFSLAQVNSKEEGWTIWGAAETDPAAKGRLAFRAAEAARRQGRFPDLHTALLEARHQHHRDLDDAEVIEQLAGEATLDMGRFRRDMADPSILEALAEDHQAAVSELGVFGTPTLHLPGKGVAYVRVRPAPEGSAALELLDQLVRIVGEEPYLVELKRPPRPPVLNSADALKESSSPPARGGRLVGGLGAGIYPGRKTPRPRLSVAPSTACRGRPLTRPIALHRSDTKQLFGHHDPQEPHHHPKAGAHS
jgi:predicted DsbA family dithiol-disulfide isomerase